MYAHHDEAAETVPIGAAALFDHLDDQERLAAHMEKPSMMMMGGRMFYEFDAAKGRAVGSVIRMGGNFLWFKLLVEEEVIVHEPPNRKVWETRGPSNLIIIGGYRMGFEIKASGGASNRVSSSTMTIRRRLSVACLEFCSLLCTHAGV
jgi:hypothetical protein